jgi:hypothetical protein
MDESFVLSNASTALVVIGRSLVVTHPSLCNYGRLAIFGILAATLAIEFAE